MGLQGSEVRILSPRPLNKGSHFRSGFFMSMKKVPDSNRSEVRQNGRIAVLDAQSEATCAPQG